MILTDDIFLFTGDIMGCGIFFPLDYDEEGDNQDENGDGEERLPDDDVLDDPINNLLWDSDDEDHPLMWPPMPRHRREKGKKVKV